MIFHITDVEELNKTKTRGYLSNPSLEIEGFIHLCTDSQISGVLNRYFQGKKDLILMTINPDKLDVPLRYEWSDAQQESFPHVYGTIKISAIESFSEIDPV
jgi:uncharacterized protein (DUF952 family)